MQRKQAKKKIIQRTEEEKNIFLREFFCLYRVRVFFSSLYNSVPASPFFRALYIFECMHIGTEIEGEQ
jgi:hypothetical protein